MHDALEKITQEIIDQETESETRANMKERLVRYQSVMIKRSHIIKSTQEKLKSLELSFQPNSSLSEEFIEEQWKELEVASNKSKKLETELKKGKDLYKINLETMRLVLLHKATVLLSLRYQNKRTT